MILVQKGVASHHHSSHDLTYINSSKNHQKIFIYFLHSLGVILSNKVSNCHLSYVNWLILTFIWLILLRLVILLLILIILIHHVSKVKGHLLFIILLSTMTSRNDISLHMCLNVWIVIVYLADKIANHRFQLGIVNILA